MFKTIFTTLWPLWGFCDWTGSIIWNLVYVGSAADQLLHSWWRYFRDAVDHRYASKKSLQLSWCTFDHIYMGQISHHKIEVAATFKNPVDVCHTWVTCGLHYSWVIPARLVMCVILGHEKCKIQDIMDCEKIRGSVRYWVWVKNKILFVHFSNCGFCSNRILPYFPLSVRSSHAWHLPFLTYIKA